MNDTIIKAMVEDGIKNQPESKLVGAYNFITKTQLRTNCSSCAKRKAMNTIIRYYKEKFN